MHGPLSRAAEIFNYVEVALWPALGAGVLVLALRCRRLARLYGMIAAITLFAFGASDWFENRTGGEWWHPWWLLLWKAACVMILLALTTVAYRTRRAHSTAA
jgi:hypothetical protein